MPISSTVVDDPSASVEPRLVTLRQIMLDALRPHIDPLRPAALIDFPNHSNVGDSAIWRGELAWLRALGVARIAYQGEAHLHNPAQLARVIADGQIFLHGGGNFRDLWPAHQRFRERIVEAFPDNTVVFLPQTVHFQDRRNLAWAAERLNRHRKLTIFVRDRDSLDALAPLIEAPVVACPDPTLFLSLASRRKPPLQDFLLLARTDLEAAESTGSLTRMFPTTDWLEEPLTPLLRYFGIAQRIASLSPTKFEFARAHLAGMYESVAWQRVRRGCDILSRGRVVITDRLHGHLLCLLLGIDHVILDNNYGKVAGFHREWTAGIRRAQLCSPLHVEGPLSRRLLTNLIEFQRAWSLWAPHTYAPVEITCAALVEEAASKRSAAVAAFSGGVDAAFGVLYHTSGLAQLDRVSIGTAMLVHGFDIGLDSVGAFALARQNAQATTHQLGNPLATVRTNFKTAVSGNWEHDFAASLAACLHLFCEAFDTGLMGTDEDYEHFVLPWGSNPVTNPLLSSAGMIVITEGAGYTRTE